MSDCLCEGKMVTFDLLIISQDVHYMMLLYHFDLCPLSAFNYRSPNLDYGFVDKVWPVEGPQ